MADGKITAIAFLTSMITTACKFKASDIHLRAGHPVMVRVDGSIRHVKGSPVLSEEKLLAMFKSIMTDFHNKLFEQNNQVDLSFADENNNRVRVNIFRQMGRLAVVMRVIEKEIRTPDELGLPPQVANITGFQRGLVIFSGATGSGKSTSMASLLNEMNKVRYDHILTIEDPIEYVFTEDKCVISQREVGIDVPSFELAMKSALREDPDIILMGEMRDAESIEIALDAAETGHLVFSTLHAPTAIDSVTRMVSSFVGRDQATVRVKIAQNLQSVVTQRLVKAKDGGRVAACEVMTVNALARELIIDPLRIKEIQDLLKSEDKIEGMLHFDEHLKQLVDVGKITKEEALQNASSPTDLGLKLKGF